MSYDFIQLDRLLVFALFLLVFVAAGAVLLRLISKGEKAEKIEVAYETIPEELLTPAER